MIVKKIINVIWVLLILGAVLDGTQMRVKAGNLVYGDYEYSQNPSDKTISIIKYNGKDSEVEIPQKINGMNVVSISEEAFQFNDIIVDVVIPEGVTGIGSSAFSCCSNLKQVSFPDSLEKIGFTAFYNCESLENIYIPENVNTIATEAFSGCSNIKKIQVAVNNKVFDSRNNCNAVINTSNDELIVGCMNTRLDYGLKRIGQCAFRNVTGLYEINVPSSVASIGESAFYGCINLHNISLSENLQKIGERAFGSCEGITSIELPDGIKEIGSYVFSFCGNLKSIYIPASVERMGAMVFDEHSDDLIIRCYRWSNAYKYAIDCSIQYEVLEVVKTDISDAIIQGIEDKTYDGAFQKQRSITIFLNGIQLQEGRDYTLTYENNKNPGKAKIIISGIENYTGTIDRYFYIIKPIVDIGKIYDVDIIGIPKSVIYEGGRITFQNVQVKVEGTVLNEKTDYILTYNNNINVGNASIVITGKGDYSGTIKKNFLIKSRDISLKNNQISVCGVPDSDIYTGKTCVYPEIVVKCGNTIMKVGKDYTIGYHNNKNIGIAKVIISGKGNYSGSITKRVKIRIQTGKVYNVGNLKYRVTDSRLDGCGMVSLTGAASRKNSKKIVKLIIPNNVVIGGVRFSVVSIGDNAFREYVNIKSVSIGSNVKSIGKRAFYGCRMLSSVKIGNNVCVINERALAGCSELKRLTITTTKLTINSVRAGALKGVNSKIVIRVPVRKLKEYKKILTLRGVSKKAKIIK